MFTRFAIAVTATLFVSSAQAEVPFYPPTRTWDGEVVQSPEAPAASFQVSEDFTYVGAFAFDLRGVARVERHIWAEAQNGEVEGVIILQFEHLLDHVDGEYGFSVPPADGQSGGDYVFSPERVDFGDATYVQNTWAFDMAANAAANPDAESDLTLQFLAVHDLQIADEVIMSRAVRATGEGARSEIILFYIEPLARHGAALDDFNPEGPALENIRTLSAEITARHMDVLRVMPLD